MKDKKFKIGDRVKAIDKVDGADLKGFTGTVIAYYPSDCYDIGVEFDECVPRRWAQHDCRGKGKKGYCRWGYESEFELIAPNNNKKIVITSDGIETLARLYEGNKVVKSATAKCSPHDEYDFETGTKIAFDRLISNEEKPKYKAGDKVRVIANTCLHGANIGDVLTLDKKFTRFKHLTDAWDVKEAKNYFIIERDFEPYTGPEYFTGKVVCVNDGNISGLTVGKIYDFSLNDGCGLADDGAKIVDSPCCDIEALNNRFNKIKFIPLVE